MFAALPPDAAGATALTTAQKRLPLSPGRRAYLLTALFLGFVGGALAVVAFLGLLA